MNIGVILARHGSKRLPGKNTLPFAALPLVQWTLIEAMRATTLDRVIVSTDDPEIARLSYLEGATVVPRPEQYARDESTSYEALEHVIDHLRLHQDVIVLLPPTSPLREAADIDNCVNLAMKNADRTALSVAEGEDAGNGAIYVATASWILAGGNWDEPGPVKFEMPPSRSHDIDTLEDFEQAQADVQH